MREQQLFRFESKYLKLCCGVCYLSHIDVLGVDNTNKIMTKHWQESAQKHQDNIGFFTLKCRKINTKTQKTSSSVIFDNLISR